MIKTIIILSLLNIYSFGFDKFATAKYKITYGSFLTLGEANALMKTKNNQYEISIEAKATGLAQVLTNNRIELFKSIGDVVDNKFIPKEFINIKKDTYNFRKRVYKFKKDKIEVFYEENKKIRKLDDELNITYMNKKHKSKYNLDYNAKDDLLSLFFNFKDLYPKLKNEKLYELKAVGANKTKGRVDIFIPKNQENLNQYLKTNSKIKFIATINQKIFQSQKGELFLSINDKGFCDYAVLKDVIFFGDIVGEMYDLKIGSLDD